MAYEETAKELVKGRKDAPPPESDEDDEGEAAPDDEMDSYDDVEDSAGDELATLAGVKDKAAFKSALRDYVEACVRRSQE